MSDSTPEVSSDLSSESATDQVVHWPEVLSALLAGEDLDRMESASIMHQIFSGQATEAQIAAFLIALKSKGETPEEVLGLVDQMQAHAVPVNVPGPVLDVVGTGGDRSDSVNISTMTAIVAAAAGATVVKHGNRAASSQSGSADVLESLGVVIDLPSEAVEQCVERVGIGFCFAPVFHPAMRFAGPARKQIGVPTVFNILGPLANPAKPSALLVGCADPRMAPIMARVFADQGTGAVVVRGSDGLDEATIFDSTQIWDASVPGDVERTVLELDDLGIAQGHPGSLRGADAAYNAQVVRDVFGGSDNPALAGVRDAVALNAALALAVWNTVSKRTETGLDNAGRAANPDHIKSQLAKAYETIDSGEALKLLDHWIEVSQELAN
ncbi:MAG: anthranilate phosphoribosyltransferase [Candidatus Nanopelagicales bacterium]